jgi:plastocyanin
MKTTLYALTTIVLMLTIVPQPHAFATKHVVNVQNFSFTPASIPNVQLGDTIRWVWLSGSHTTTSTTIPSGAATWDSPLNSSNTSFEYKVVVAGTFNYKCTPHASMGMTGSFSTASAATLSVAPANQNVTAVAGNTTFNVTSNSSWTSVSNSAWCSATPSGSGNGTITASYSANSSTIARTAIITVTVTGLPAQTVTVSQAGAAATLSVAPANRDVTPDAGSTTFSVTSNSNWTASCNSAWCNVTPSGSGSSTITANYGENTEVNQRVAIVSVVVSGLPVQTVTVTQGAAARTLSVTPANQDVAATAGTTMFSVFSNSTWTAQSDANWCTPTPSGTGDGTILAAYDENPGNSPRTATLTITVPGIPDQTVTVNQALSTVSIDVQSAAAGFRLFPNPAKGLVEIELHGIKSQDTKVSLMALSGKVVLEKNYSLSTPLLIDASSLPKGIYIVKLKTADSQYLQRLILID